ncbi:hypothetical protein [Xanthomonas campestris]|uniref:Uncharacterized protein n=1 Tax=Xanthomonas campestris pv. papavericola TaxID=487881 RepID=A0AAJ2X5S8_XANCA|nr:hypothetical protein [Xanthomonas campestris]MEC3889782.1 hypothetical protein [Xanthomonas campestris pv. papavericola]
MKNLSYDRSPLPPLVIRSSELTLDLIAALDRSNVAHPTSRISDSFWAVVEQLHEMLVALDFGSLDAQSRDRRKRSILGNMELLMHRLAALNDYLGNLIRTLLPIAPGQKKNREAEAAKHRLDDQVNRFYKMPINFIKHDGFGLSWIEMNFGDLVTHGYIVTGPIGGGVQGPIKFRRPGRDDPDGYSFALTLREVLAAFYQMCATTEEVLGKAGVLTAASKEKPSAVNGKKSVVDDVRSILLSETLELLNQLPFRGFPDEHQIRVPVFSMRDVTVMTRTSPLRKLPGAFQIQSELRSVRGGGRYQLPYWRGSNSDL